MEANKRLLSLDALRGLDMLFIMGLCTLITSVCALFPNGSESWIASQMEHVSWNGMTHQDTIFPLFLFISGISYPFSHAKSLAKGVSRGHIYRKIFTRGFVLVLFGLICNGLFKLEWADMRLPSVLGRIGLAWMFAALLFVNLGVRARAIVAASILVLYWLLLKIPAPDFPGADPLSLEGNIVGYIDRQILGLHHIYKWDAGIFDPEGILSTLPAIVTAMMGMFTGEFVQAENLGGKKLSGNQKTLYMLVAAAVFTVAGLIWDINFPINKKLWSSSFVMVLGGLSLASFALFYWIIDVKGWSKWTFFFRVIGMNSITIFMACRIINFRGIEKFFIGGIAAKMPELWSGVFLDLGYIITWWLFLYFLYKQKIFLRV